MARAVRVRPLDDAQRLFGTVILEESEPLGREQVLERQRPLAAAGTPGHAVGAPGAILLGADACDEPCYVKLDVTLSCTSELRSNDGPRGTSNPLHFLRRQALICGDCPMVLLCDGSVSCGYASACYVT